MELCENGHDQVCFEKSYCPACEMNDELQIDIKELKKDIQENDKYIKDLEQDIRDLTNEIQQKEA